MADNLPVATASPGSTNQSVLTVDQTEGTFILESKELWMALFTMINLIGPQYGISFTSPEWAAIGVVAIALIRIFKTSGPIIWQKIEGSK